MIKLGQKLQLFGFNNLSKSLYLSLYEVYYTDGDKKKFVEYVNTKHSARRLTALLTDVAEKIGATVLNISEYDYDPQGASAVLLIAEEPEAVVAHLDKSHITIHTYPDFFPGDKAAVFRADIDVATCGEISPLSTLNYLIDSFGSDIITLDYKIRGFTRCETGKKLYTDTSMDSIQAFIDTHIRNKYTVRDVNLPQANIFHSRMMKKNIPPNSHSFDLCPAALSPPEQNEAAKYLHHEMSAIFAGFEIPREGREVDPR
ncbi:MAG: adenosylmethionine decarboxylase [Defluviitaleaceae bacterium]|nr:adenosylmethionine decarboxylase [Defluviitaleaceae bacterium]MCL2239657.1 adenosylmethionine decarboxylase [Defluviitaleaceae bacterium]